MHNNERPKLQHNAAQQYVMLRLFFTISVLREEHCFMIQSLLSVLLTTTVQGEPGEMLIQHSPMKPLNTGLKEEK